MTPTALAKYGKGQSTDDLGLAVEMLFERNLLPRLPPQAQINTNDFRTERLYMEEVSRERVCQTVSPCPEKWGKLTCAHPPTKSTPCSL